MPLDKRSFGNFIRAEPLADLDVEHALKLTPELITFNPLNSGFELLNVIW